MTRMTLRFAMFTLLTLFSGCSLIEPIQGYPGEVRSEAETALIRVDSEGGDDSRNLQISAITVDSVPLSGAHQGISVLPGSHRVRFDWTLDDQSDSQQGLNVVWEKYGSCDATFAVQAGQKYLAYATVQNEGSWVTNPQVQVEIRDAASTFSLRQVERPTPCMYIGRRIGSYLDLSK